MRYFRRLCMTYQRCRLCLQQTAATYTVRGLHVFPERPLYQRYFGKQYLTGDVVSE